MIKQYPTHTLTLHSEAETVALGQRLAEQTPSACSFYLYGHLGAGKTTLVRAFIQFFMPDTLVKSPTYSLIESYKIDSKTMPVKKPFYIHHLDLYRLNHPEELEYCGLRDYLKEEAIFFIEWPDQGEKSELPPVDIQINIACSPNNSLSRQLTLVAHTPCGNKLLQAL